MSERLTQAYELALSLSPARGFNYRFDEVLKDMYRIEPRPPEEVAERERRIAVIRRLKREIWEAHCAPYDIEIEVCACCGVEVSIWSRKDRECTECGESTDSSIVSSFAVDSLEKFMSRFRGISFEALCYEDTFAWEVGFFTRVRDILRDEDGGAA